MVTNRCRGRVGDLYDRYGACSQKHVLHHPTSSDSAETEGVRIAQQFHSSSTLHPETEEDARPSVCSSDDRTTAAVRPSVCASASALQMHPLPSAPSVDVDVDIIHTADAHPPPPTAPSSLIPLSTLPLHQHHHHQQPLSPSSLPLSLPLPPEIVLHPLTGTPLCVACRVPVASPVHNTHPHVVLAQVHAHLSSATHARNYDAHLRFHSLAARRVARRQFIAFLERECGLSSPAYANGSSKMNSTSDCNSNDDTNYNNNNDGSTLSSPSPSAPTTPPTPTPTPTPTSTAVASLMPSVHNAFVLSPTSSPTSSASPPPSSMSPLSSTLYAAPHHHHPPAHLHSQRRSEMDVQDFNFDFSLDPHPSPRPHPRPYPISTAATDSELVPLVNGLRYCFVCGVTVAGTIADFFDHCRSKPHVVRRKRFNSPFMLAVARHRCITMARQRGVCGPSNTSTKTRRTPSQQSAAALLDDADVDLNVALAMAGLSLRHSTSSSAGAVPGEHQRQRQRQKRRLQQQNHYHHQRGFQPSYFKTTAFKHRGAVARPAFPVVPPFGGGLSYHHDRKVKLRRHYDNATQDEYGDSDGDDGLKFVRNFSIGDTPVVSSQAPSVHRPEQGYGSDGDEEGKDQGEARADGICGLEHKLHVGLRIIEKMKRNNGGVGSLHGDSAAHGNLKHVKSDVFDIGVVAGEQMGEQEVPNRREGNVKRGTMAGEDDVENMGRHWRRISWLTDDESEQAMKRRVSEHDSDERRRRRQQQQEQRNGGNMGSVRGKQEAHAFKEEIVEIE